MLRTQRSESFPPYLVSNQCFLSAHYVAPNVPSVGWPSLCFAHSTSAASSIVDTLPRTRTPAPLPTTSTTTTIPSSSSTGLSGGWLAHDSVVDGQGNVQEGHAVALLDSVLGFIEGAVLNEAVALAVCQSLESRAHKRIDQCQRDGHTFMYPVLRSIANCKFLTAPNSAKKSWTVSSSASS